MSEVIPQDEDRGGDGALEGATAEREPEDGPTEGSEEPGTHSDDGGPGSQNM
jgi:hypothetical protein